MSGSGNDVPPLHRAHAEPRALQPQRAAALGDWRDRLAFGPIRLAAVVLPLVLALGFAWWSWREVEQRGDERATHTAALLQGQLERALEVQDAIIAAVQARTEGMAWAEIAASREVWELIRRLDGAAPNTFRLGLIDPQARLAQISSMFPAPAAEMSDRDYVHAVRTAEAGTSVIGEPVLGRMSREAVMPYARARLGADGRPDGGVIWTTLQIAQVTALFERVAGPDDTIILARADGAMLVRQPALVEELAPRLPAGSVPMATVVQALSDGADGGTGYARGLSPFDGRMRIHAARRVGMSDAVVIYGRSMAEMRAAWLEQSAWMAVPAAITSALLLFLTLRGQAAVRREIAAQAAARVAAEQRADIEATLRQAQRMEVLGRLSAGLVHDVRNTMQAVQAGVSLIERATAQGDAARVHEVAEMVREAIGRAGQLTQRLLAGGATREGAAGMCDPAATVAAACGLLQSALGPQYRLEQRLADGLPRQVGANPAELDSAVVNLIVNARDAMPGGGEIVVAMRAVGAAPALPDGAYVELSVTDTGVGMDAATQARAMEAFFTTKGHNGSGLGLSSIRAFVRGCGGTMTLRSAPGAGTTVTLWLPAVAEGRG
jgi:signal transduction histidine kinase